MALIVKDRVRETSTTTGTGTITLAGASTGFRSFADIGNGNTTYYCISGGSQFEVGIGTYTASGTTLSRDTVLSNSLGTTALINFSAGSKDVFCTYPSGKAILGDTSAVASTGTGSVVLSDSPIFAGVVDMNTCTDVVLPDTQITSAFNTTGAITTTNVVTAGFLTCAGQLTLSGATTANQTLATAQTTGSLTIGGTGATGAITIGQSTGAQNINISNGSASTSIVNIGGTGLSTGAINIGRSTGTQTISIGSGSLGGTVTSSGTRTINIGSTSTGTGISNVTIGKTASTVDHTTNINGRYINLNAGTALSLGTAPLTLPTRINQSVDLVTELITGVVGSRAFVTDALSPVFGMPVNGGGSTPVPVYFDGTTWRVG